MNIKLNYILFLGLFSCSLIFGQSWQSKIVYYDSDSSLVYVRDSLGNAIPDFSYAGYHNGNDSIPYVPVVKTIGPVDGDNTSNINNALYETLRLLDSSSEKRGALLLKPGLYQVDGTIKLQYDGVTLRGSGDGDDPNSATIIKAVGNSPSKRTVLIAGGGTSTKWADSYSGSRQDITSDTVLVGENSFNVANASIYNVGDNIIIYHPCTEKWLEAIDYGGTHSDAPSADPEDVPWSVNSQPIVFNRNITKIEDNTIYVDVPFYYSLVRDLSQSYVYKYTRKGIRTEIGIENLRIDIEYSGSETDESHAKNAIDLFLIEDAWVRNVTTLHFYEAGFRTNTATRITIENCKALDPVAQITGGRRYNFEAYTASQQILFQNNIATNGRHSYMSNGTSWTSGIVFYNNTSEGAYAASEGHRRWSQGLLYDNHTEIDNVRPGYNRRRIGLYNRAYYGTSHGWASVNSVTWNCDVKDGQILIQQPPTAQNYSIGCFASLIAGHGDSSFDEPEGYIEGSNKPGLEPKSLYLAQLKDRKDIQVSIKHQDNLISNNFNLYQNYPNPFNPTTNIRVDIAQSGTYELNVYTMLGEKIETVFNGRLNNGTHNFAFNAAQFASGVYFYRIVGNGFAQSKKMVLSK